MSSTFYRLKQRNIQHTHTQIKFVRKVLSLLQNTVHPTLQIDALSKSQIKTNTTSSFARLKMTGISDCSHGPRTALSSFITLSLIEDLLAARHPDNKTGVTFQPPHSNITSRLTH